MTPTPATTTPSVTPPTRRRVRRGSIAVALFGGLGSVALLTACGDLGIGLPSAGSSSVGATSPTTVPAKTPASSGAASAGTISQQQAAAAALAAVGTGTVTWIGPEDDRGAAWEVEVTRPNGTEVDVLVAANGTIIAMIDKPGER